MVEREPKTLLEHMGVKGNAMEKLKKIAFGFLLFAALGFLIGAMLDAMLGTSNYSVALMYVMLIIFLVKTFSKYLSFK